MKTDIVSIPFETGEWDKRINVYDFIIKNIKPYTGDATFLKGPTARTIRLWEACKAALLQESKNNGVLAIDTDTVSSITAFTPGYIKKDDEVIVGLQTDLLLKRAMKPFGGIKFVESAINERGLKVSERVTDIFKYAKDHNQGVFNAYDNEIRAFRYHRH